MERDDKVLCDIVLPVHNSLTFVKECIDSIEEYTKDCQHKLFIIDDASDSYTKLFLEKRASENKKIELFRNKNRLGYIKSCNSAIIRGKSPYVLLINSDVIVTPRWLPRLIKCIESDSLIACVNPLTNYASNINIPIAPGANFFGMDELLSKQSLKFYPDVVTGVGFCMLLKRSVLEKIGSLDEVFGEGYCEDSDLCMRLTGEGYRTVVASDVYVYHKGRASFNYRDERYTANRKIFDDRWFNEYKRQFNQYRINDPLKRPRDLFNFPKRWAPIPLMRETYRNVRHAWRNGNHIVTFKEVAKCIRNIPKAKQPKITAKYISRVTRPGRLKVTYVLDNLCVAGGVLSVVQLVNELIILGVEARIVALRDYPEIYNWRFYTRPAIYKSVNEMINCFPESDIVLATRWTTAPWAAEVVKRGKANKAVYYIQDYESWFYPESDMRRRAQVKETYNMIPYKIVKSAWLNNLLHRDGYSSKIIHLGMDLATFYPRSVNKSNNMVLFAMARPRTPRRGFQNLIESIYKVTQVEPNLEVVLYGDELFREHIPFSYRDEGIITDQQKLAELYSRADLYLDSSTFQGFGRPALEAMACGCACVLTSIGGVNEYARHEDNCLLVGPGDPDAFASATKKLILNNNLRKTLSLNGQETVKAYSSKREARETLNYFQSL